MSEQNPRPLGDRHKKQLLDIILRDRATEGYFWETMCHLLGVEVSRTGIPRSAKLNRQKMFWFRHLGNWLANEILPALKRHGLSMETFPVSPAKSAELLRSVYTGPLGARRPFQHIRMEFREMVARRQEEP